MPKTLDETYERILQNIDDEYHGDAFKVLQWLAFSGRPVTPVELVEALAVEFTGDKPEFNPDQRMPNPWDILVMCSSLVTTQNPNLTLGGETEDHASDAGEEALGCFNFQSQRLRLAHASVKEIGRASCRERV